MDKQESQYLLTVAAIQERSNQILQLSLKGKTHFNLYLENLEKIADLTAQITQNNYPDKQIPLHSRWRHFVINNNDYSDFLKNLPQPQQVKAKLDLAMVSVLLDAGAGPQWRYKNDQGQSFSRSEGLAIASLEMFKSGFFSSNNHEPYRVDGAALQQLSYEKLKEKMQVNSVNPLLGLEGRLFLLQNLGKILTENSIFNEARPGGIYDFLKENQATSICVSELVNLLLTHGFNLGDMWFYPAVGWIPFHKLSLWLTFSLVEPLQETGFHLTGLEKLPGLAEYRNGGLFIDGGVLAIKNPNFVNNIHHPGDALIVEWRALTIALLEKLVVQVKQKLGEQYSTLNILQVLQGGTWQAGRQLAYQRSKTGEPPLKYTSTGTLF